MQAPGKHAPACTLRVQGLDCPSEVPPLRQALESIDGVSDPEFTPSEGLVRVSYDPALVQPRQIAERVSASSGMTATVLPPALDTVSPAEPPPSPRGPWLFIGLSGLCLAIGTVRDWMHGNRIEVLAFYALAIAFASVEILPQARRALLGRRLGIHLLVTLAVAGALLLGDWGEAATVSFLFALSEGLESLSLDRARRAVRGLLEVAPDTAVRLGSSGEQTEIPASDVEVGDRLLVRSGMRVPVDGLVVSGRSSIDQKTITGESVPVSREPGDPVFAGTVNGEGTLEIQATRVLGESVVSRTIALVRKAQASRTPTERAIERFASVYTPVVFAVALALMVLPPVVETALGWPTSWRAWFEKGLVVLVVACPCALVIGTPVAIVSALAAAARRGVLVKGGEFLESIGGLKVMAFDKTGTLTLGRPDVVQVVPVLGNDPGGMLRVAAALGDRGGHVLGRAIARHARELDLDVPPADDYQAVPGLGARGRVDQADYHIGSHRYLDETGLCDSGDFHRSLGVAEREAGTSVAVSAPDGPMGYIRLADRPRPEAARVLAELRDLGLRTVMLTGDNEPTAAAIASDLGLAEHHASLLPEDKARVVSQIDRAEGPTGMVGDGVNDAPALAAARVSVALGGISSAAALEAADVVLMADDLSGLPWLIRHSRRALARVRQNIALAISVKILALLLAIAGLAGMWMAIAADVGTTLVVVANALRLLRSTDR